MPNISKPRKKAIRFKDSSKHKRKVKRVYYIIKDDINVYIDNITNHDINNPIPIPTSYQSIINDPIYDTVWKEAVQTELNTIISNDIFKIVKKPEGVNIVITR